MSTIFTLTQKVTTFLSGSAIILKKNLTPAMNFDFLFLISSPPDRPLKFKTMTSARYNIQHFEISIGLHHQVEKIYIYILEKYVEFVANVRSLRNKPG